MKAESDPITEDEFLLRLVWEDRVTSKAPIISPNSFEPRPNETDGISFYRRDCLKDPADALVPIAPEKRDRYAIVQIPVSTLRSLNLTVEPRPRSDVPGHVVAPELNVTDYLVNKG